MNEQQVLTHDPFAGDFGGPGDRCLKDKMVTARKSGPCHNCNQVIQTGDRVRSRSDIADGELMSFRWCRLCCEAMAADDDGAEVERRIEIGMASRGELPA